MITPSQFRTAIRDAVELALPTARRATTPVNWAGGAREFGDQRLLLNVVSERGANWEREDLFAAAGQSVESLVESSVEIRAESTYDSSDSDALDLLNSVRYGLSRLSVVELLRAAGVVQPLPPGPTFNVSFRSDNRLISAHAFEVVFRCVFGLESDEPMGLIEHVELAGTVASPSGSDVVSVGPLAIDDPTPEP